MPRQTRDRDTTWVLDGDNKTWILTTGATIETEGSTAIHDGGTGSRIHVLGTAHSEFATGVRMEDDSASLFVGRNGAVTSGENTAVTAWRGGRVENHGLIAGGDIGISKEVSSYSFTVINTGTIAGASAAIIHTSGPFTLDNTGIVDGGDVGISLISIESAIVNGEEGLIVGDEAAIHYRLAGQHSLVNKGLISGEDFAIVAQDGTTVTIRNAGIIAGDVMLGDGADRIDTREGSIRGEMRGGGGDDLYLVSRTSTSVTINDTGASFGDCVRSTAGFAMRDGLDRLILLGGKDIFGSGNDGDNLIRGNDGDNAIFGFGGSDTLCGGAGRDELEGGSGADVFEFRKGSDVDRVVDYTDGVDRLTSRDVATQGQFDRLDIRRSGDDLIIDFGSGDRLILEDVAKADIDLSDFVLA